MKAIKFVVISFFLICIFFNSAFANELTPLPYPGVYQSSHVDATSIVNKTYESYSMGTLNTSDSYQHDIYFPPPINSNLTFDMSYSNTARAYGETRTVEAMTDISAYGGTVYGEDGVPVAGTVATSPVMYTSVISRMTYFVGLEVLSEEHLQVLEEGDGINEGIPVNMEIKMGVSASSTEGGSAGSHAGIYIHDFESDSIIPFDLYSADDPNGVMDITGFGAWVEREYLSDYITIPLWEVVLEASAGAVAQAAFNGICDPDLGGICSSANSFQSASAWADPYFYIDPEWEHADKFEIIVSEGVNNTPAVPIPSAIWLLGSGLIGIVGIRRKVKK